MNADPMNADPMNAGDTARAYMAAFATGDPQSIAAYVADRFENEHLSELGSGCIGRAEYLSRLPEFLETFAERNYTIEDLVEGPVEGESRPAADATVVVRYRFAATFEGTRIDIPGVMWFVIRDGLILRRSDLWDSLTFLRQTGQPIPSK
jgi:ketosteroid isomerase-like protein